MDTMLAMRSEINVWMSERCSLENEARRGVESRKRSLGKRDFVFKSALSPHGAVTIVHVCLRRPLTEEEGAAM